MSFEQVMPSNHLVLCRPLTSVFPSIKVFPMHLATTLNRADLELIYLSLLNISYSFPYRRLLVQSKDLFISQSTQQSLSGLCIVTPTAPCSLESPSTSTLSWSMFRFFKSWSKCTAVWQNHPKMVPDYSGQFLLQISQIKSLYSYLLRKMINDDGTKLNMEYNQNQKTCCLS